MNVICLAIVTDALVTRVSADRRRFEAWRKPEPGELYHLSQEEFKRAKALVEQEGISVVTHPGELTPDDAAGPRAIISAEGADFLEDKIERVDEAFTLYQLRHLQLTHYRKACGLRGNKAAGPVAYRAGQAPDQPRPIDLCRSCTRDSGHGRRDRRVA
ncbi:hypothetical protein [Cupriavidus sp. RAF20_2]|uniref:hypothetical protein n=1 Tax=Cupriavidus sp. RAF20_2 TaxID=3233053 RepID=UPI003F938F90